MPIAGQRNRDSAFLFSPREPSALRDIFCNLQQRYKRSQGRRLIGVVGSCAKSQRTSRSVLSIGACIRTRLPRFPSGLHMQRTHRRRKLRASNAAPLLEFSFGSFLCSEHVADRGAPSAARFQQAQPFSGPWNAYAAGSRSNSRRVRKFLI
jgi:hypothetical protein